MSSSDKNIFINGKKQIIEMLQFMNEDERQKLLDNIQYKNPSMARELREKSFSFNSLFSMNEDVLRQVLRSANATIVGLALYITSEDNQRRALSLMMRSEAEKAFHIMNQNLSNKKNECQKAQERLKNLAITVSRRKNL